jgi:hypothetical protein
MKKTTLLLITVLAISLTVSIVAARELPAITAAHRNQIKTMLKNYFIPTIHGWGVGYDCTSDNHITAKFHVVSTKILPRHQIMAIIREAKAGNARDWSDVVDRLKAAIDANATIVSKGRISINGVKYLLTNISKGETSLTADIRTIVDFATCKQENISAEDCELRGEKVGDVTITRRVQTELPGEPRIWGGTLNFNNTSYKFVALVYPRSGT